MRQIRTDPHSILDGVWGPSWPFSAAGLLGLSSLRKPSWLLHLSMLRRLCRWGCHGSHSNRNTTNKSNSLPSSTNIQDLPSSPSSLWSRWVATSLWSSQPDSEQLLLLIQMSLYIKWLQLSLTTRPRVSPLTIGGKWPTIFSHPFMFLCPPLLSPFLLSYWLDRPYN